MYLIKQFIYCLLAQFGIRTLVAMAKYRFSKLNGVCCSQILWVLSISVRYRVLAKLFLFTLFKDNFF